NGTTLRFGPHERIVLIENLENQISGRHYNILTKLWISCNSEIFTSISYKERHMTIFKTNQKKSLAKLTT
ncbi:MAG: hypothetical protein D3908_17065, partial [Candidatus Electrothrix sp. AUS4]|nr:hypothetical protein [Candidatus Electrothrix sp. AUS4]